MYDRLTHEEEYDLMSPSTNFKNMKAFSKLLPHFYYKSKHNKRIRNAARQYTASAIDLYLDKKLNLNAQRRAWYRVPVLESEDKAYAKYREYLINATIHARNLELYIKTLRYGLLDYDTYLEGRFSIGKQNIRLFKFLLKNKVMTRKQVEEITTIRNNDNLYLCISRNPVDYLFCSTGQSFSSCISLNSEYSGAYYMGLGALPLDPNRVIIFLTPGKLRKRQIKGKTFKFFRYVYRTWGILLNTGNIAIVRGYPHDTVINIKRVFKEIGVDIGNNGAKQSMFSFHPAEYIDGTEAHIYYDTIGPKSYRYVQHTPKPKKLNKRKKNKWRSRFLHKLIYTYEGCYEGCPVDFEYSGGFDNLTDFDMLYDGSYRCVYCDSLLGSDNVYWAPNDEPLCGDCYDEHYFTCNYCGAIYSVDEAVEDVQGNIICSDCTETYHCQCDECGGAVREDDIVVIDNVYYCDYCASNIDYIQCDECGENSTEAEEYVGTDDKKSCVLCPECSRRIVSRCDVCGGVIIRGGERNGANQLLCNRCNSNVCAICGVASNNTTEVEDVMVCEFCYNGHTEVCDICANVVMLDNCIEVDGKIMCKNCQSEVSDAASF